VVGECWGGGAPPVGHACGWAPGAGCICRPGPPDVSLVRRATRGGGAALLGPVTGCAVAARKAPSRGPSCVYGLRRPVEDSCRPF